MLVETPNYGVSLKDAKTLVDLDDGDRLDYYLEVVDLVQQSVKEHGESSVAEPAKIGRMVANWVLHELGGLLTTSSAPFTPDLVPSTQLAVILANLLRKQITGRTAKYLLSTIFNMSSQPTQPRSVEQIINEENLLLRPMSKDEYVALAKEVLEGNEKIVDEVRKGKTGKLKFFVGQMVRHGDEGRVEALEAERVLRETLGLRPT